MPQDNYFFEIAIDVKNARFPTGSEVVMAISGYDRVSAIIGSASGLRS